MTDQDLITIIRNALDDYHGYVASDPTEPDVEAYAALAGLEAERRRLATWISNGDMALPNDVARIVRAALARTDTPEQWGARNYMIAPQPDSET